MPATYEPIATQTLVSGADTITFSSIGSGYTDLRLVLVAKAQPTNTRFPAIRFNSDTGTNYSRTRITGDGTNAASARVTDTTSIAVLQTGMGDTIPVLITCDIFSYAGSTNKTVLWEASEDANGSGSVVRGVALWRNTAAITSITLTATSGSGIYAIGTTATLYGIKNA